MIRAAMSPKKTAKNIKEGYRHYQEVIAPAAFATGADMALRYYDGYRRASFWVMFVCMIISAALKLYGFVVFFATMLHLQIMFNQLWWKMVHIEHRQKEVERCSQKSYMSDGALDMSTEE